jgi:hypothetical protein
MCLNLHTFHKGHHFGLGMIRVDGSMPSEKGIVLIKGKLAEICLNLGDIFGIATDGANVMRKLGRLLGTFPQLCHAHGIHLAVVDVLYKGIAFFKKLICFC